MALQPREKLGELASTAISGNGILSSVLYVSGISIAYAGIYAPIVLLTIALLLLFYKSIYREVVEAIPLNGGAYNCLLNATSKTFAAIAGIATILLNVATAVISATVAVEYLHSIIPVPIIPSSIVVLVAIALLILAGLKDSAKVAVGIFAVHLMTLTLFIYLGLLYFITGQSHFVENLNVTHNLFSQSGLLKALFLGFSASLLGMAGFESSANFVEDQQKGVFRKTLRNMLWGVTFFNPLIVLVILNAASPIVIADSSNFLLSNVAGILGGPYFQYIVVIDSFLVLIGAVIASYIGVSGLVFRMTSDACLPSFLAKRNSKKVFPRIIISFALICISILPLTHGDTRSLAGMYAIAFLSVMSFFALGNLILRETRSELKRTYHAPILFVIIGLLATIIGIVGVINIDVNNLTYFMIYFIPAVFLVFSIIYQDYYTRILLHLSTPFPKLHANFERRFHHLTQRKLVAFVNHIDKLHSILKYINKNELGWNIILIHCDQQNSKTISKTFNDIREILPLLQKAGVFPHFAIELIFKDKEFGPEVIDEVSKELRVSKNRIMIGSIHDSHNFDYSELGGVRIIM